MPNDSVTFSCNCTFGNEGQPCFNGHGSGDTVTLRVQNTWNEGSKENLLSTSLKNFAVTKRKKSSKVLN